MTARHRRRRPTRSQAYLDDRAHVFHSWSAQARARPARRRRRRGLAVLGRPGQPLPRLLQPAGQRQHRPPAPEARRRHQGAGRQAVHGRPVPRQRGPQRGGPADRRAGARRPRHGVLHQRRRRGDRERHPHGPPAHRPPQGADDVPQLPRRDRRRDHDDRRPAALGQRAGHARAWSSSGGRTPTARRSTPPTTPRSATRALAHLADVIMVEGAADTSPPSCSRPSSARTASSSRPTATCRACATCATSTAS